MSEKKYKLEIVTPEKKVYAEAVEFSVFPGAEGELGVLADHAPLVSRLVPGEIRITRDKAVESFAVSGGFLEIMHNDVSVIAETAEAAKDIDKARALKAKAEAEETLKTARDDAAAAARLKRAVARISVAEKAVIGH